MESNTNNVLPTEEVNEAATVTAAQPAKNASWPRKPLDYLVFIPAILVAIIPLLLTLSLIGVKAASNYNMSKSYSTAIQLLNSSQYDEAFTLFRSLNNYEDSRSLAKEALYGKACTLMEQKKYEEAIKSFDLLGNHKDSATLRGDCHMQIAIDHYKNGRYEECYYMAEEYAETREDAYVYYLLGLFRGLDATGCDYETRKQVYNDLEPYMYFCADSREAFDHPFFYFIRFVDTPWATEDLQYFFEHNYGDTFNYTVPFEPIPDGYGLSYVNYDDGLHFNIVDEQGNETLWFKVTKFGNYNVLHPGTMNIEDSHGNEYFYYNVDHYKDVYGTPFYELFHEE